MKSILLAFALALGLCAVTGCEEKTYERKVEHKSDDGTVTKDHKTVQENDQGDKTVKHEKSVDRDN